MHCHACEDKVKWTLTIIYITSFISLHHFAASPEMVKLSQSQPGLKFIDTGLMIIHQYGSDWSHLLIGIRILMYVPDASPVSL